MHRQSFRALRAAYATGDLSPVEVIRSALGHARQVNEKLNAFSLLDSSRAITLAQASEKRWHEGRPLSTLDGMPITVKDFAMVQGWPTRRGSLVTSTEEAQESAVFVDRLLEAGAVIIGKTRAPEFNWKGVTDSPGYGVTRNPLNSELTPGGSSGGCAAAVAAGVVRVSIGSDAGGSVRIPAAFTGTVALKPTYGRIPLTPLPSAFSQIVHVGPIAASIEDLIDAMQVMSGAHVNDWSSVGLQDVLFHSLPYTGRLRVGVLNKSRWQNSDLSIVLGMQDVEKSLIDAGLSLSVVDFDVQKASSIAAFFYQLGCYDVVERLPEISRSKLDAGLLDFVKSVQNVNAREMLQMQRARDEIANQYHALFEKIDVLMLPTLPILPFKAGRNTPSGQDEEDWMSWNPFTPAFNLTQSPALSFPIWRQQSALPVGVQFTAAKGNDDYVVAMGALLEQYYPIHLG